MKAEEVRIGNLVMSKGAQVTVGHISVYGDTQWLNDAGGIPLTWEWLIKLGFTGSVDSGFGKDAIELNYITTDDHFEFEYRTSSKGWMIVPVKYVHQLQNLYFALTGEELKLA